jgi:hypothetical protein
MKKILFAVLLSSAIIACNNNANEPEEPQQKIGTIDKVYWEVTDTGKLSFVRHVGAGPDTLSVEGILSFFNNRYPNVQASFVKKSNDTIFLKIPDATYLTQQMGSTGPMIYFAEIVYTLTDTPGRVYVSFDFEEGDHASPATLSRQSFDDK